MVRRMEPRLRVIWRRHPEGQKPARAWRLTSAEQEHVKAAIRVLRLHLGRRRFAEAVGISHRSARHLTERARTVSAGLALRVARIAGVSMETILTGAWRGPEACPTCGHSWLGRALRQPGKSP